MIQAVIIDDELRSLRLIRKILTENCPLVEVIGEAQGVQEGIRLIRELKPQLVFLDIEMDDGSGFDVLREFDQSAFRFIFITAHSNYAIRAFKVSAVDYVLKPVDVDDLVAAVHKAVVSLVVMEPQTSPVEYIPLRSGKETLYLKPVEISRIEGEGSYSQIFLTDGRNFWMSQNLGSFEERLPVSDFLRIHKSCIINFNYMVRFHDSANAFVEMNDGSRVPVSRRNKELVRQKLASGRRY